MGMVIAVAFTGMALRLGRSEHRAPRQPAQPAAAVRPLPDGCASTADGGTTCNLSPAQAARYLGFRPQRPGVLPPGIHLVDQALRSADPIDATSPSSEVSTGYFQRWAPVGALGDTAGQYRQQLLLAQRAAAVGDAAPQESGGCVTPARLVTLGNGRAACETAPSDTRGRLLVWRAYGIVSVLEADDVSRDQMLQFAASFA